MTSPTIPARQKPTDGRYLSDLLQRAFAAYEAMTPEQQRAMWEAQRQSWVRAFTTPCEHGELDFEQCVGCLEAARRRA